MRSSVISNLDVVRIGLGDVIRLFFVVEREVRIAYGGFFIVCL